ncbi:MAG: hypothetical protein V1921_04955 [Candidatus Altiarchaeota archaeon]
MILLYVIALVLILNLISKDFRRLFQEFGKIVSNAVNYISLTFVYFFGVGFTSLFARLFEKDFLSLRTEDRDSYWEDMNLKQKSFKDYYRQF